MDQRLGVLFCFRWQTVVVLVLPRVVETYMLPVQVEVPGDSGWIIWPMHMPTNLR